MSTSPHIAFANATSIELVPPFVVSKIFDILSDEQIEEIAEDYLKYQFKDKRSCLDDSILFCLSWMQFVVGAMHRVLHIDKTDSGDIVTMHFDMGKKWCTFFWEGPRNHVQGFQSREFNSRITNNTVTLTIHP